MNEQIASDDELLKLAREGNVEGFKGIVGKYHIQIINFYYRICRDRDLAEDLAQEVFIKLYTHLDNFELRGRLVKYIFKIARNHWIDKLRYDAPRPKLLSIDNPYRENEMSAKDYLGAEGNLPSESYEKKEVSRTISTALDKLPEEQKMVVVLCELHGFSYDEVAEIMSIPIGTVRSRLHFAISKLRGLLKDAEL
jgi:RNA polymerase sigma-70 factor (ECF subfamily)